MPELQFLPGNRHSHRGKVVDGDHFLRTDIERTGVARTGQAQRSLDAFIDEQKRARLLTVSPDFDLATIGGFRNFSANCSRCLLLAARPCPERSEAIVVSGNSG